MNKNLWIYWDTGWDNTKKIPEECLKAWKHYNPDWNIHELTDENLKDYDLDYVYRPKSKPAWSDILRITLLHRYGGLWVDATVLCNKPLNEWLEPYIEKRFFAFRDPSPANKVCSWFLYAEHNNYIVKRWKEAVDKYWENKTHPHIYLWFHGLFDKLYNTDALFKSEFDIIKEYKAPWTPKTYDGSNPHVFAPYDSNHQRVTAERVKDFTAPVYKLSHGNNTLASNQQIKSLFI